MGNISQKFLANFGRREVTECLTSLQLQSIMRAFWDRPAAFRHDFSESCRRQRG